MDAPTSMGQHQRVRKEMAEKCASFALFVIFIFLNYLIVPLGSVETSGRSSNHNARRTRNNRAVYFASADANANASAFSPMLFYRQAREQVQGQQQDQLSVLDQCCACDEAKYELVFEGLWSRYTHPDDFPENYWLAYFSDIIGASHSNDFRMWALDSLASEGVRELAESGITKKLESELKQVSVKTRTIIKARELRFPTLNSKTSAVFRTDRHHHLVSILSKLGPSPDWMLGVSGLELCQSDCSWATQRVVDLHLLDAGTDSGLTFMAPDQPTRPQAPIRYFKKGSPNELNESKGEPRQLEYALNENQSFIGGEQTLTSMEDEGQFRASSSSLEGTSQANNQELSKSASLPDEQLKPFARLTITRQRIYEKSCDSPSTQHTNPQANSVGSATVASTNEQSVASNYETSLNNLRPSSPADCRFTDWSDWSICSSQCGKGIRTRTRSFLTDDQSQLFGCQQSDLIEKEICLAECLDGSNQTICITRDWSSWSNCSVNCGLGYRKRTRAPIQPILEGCHNIELAQMEQCNGPCLQDEPVQQGPMGEKRCEVSNWSQWSECPVACGRGTKIRVRQYLRKEDAENCQVKLIQKQPCMGKSPSCNRLAGKDFEGLSNFNNHHNNGPSSNQDSPKEHNSRSSQTLRAYNPELPVIDCKLSNWGPWSTCSALCGQGKRMRSRYIIQMAQNGGKACDKKLTKAQRCRDLPPCPPLGSGSQTNSRESRHHYIHGLTPRTTSSTTTTQTSSMMDDEDDSKFSKLIKSDSGQLQLVAPSWSPPDTPASYPFGRGHNEFSLSGSNEMELIGSSSFQLRNGYIYSSLFGNTSDLSGA